jgi:hypothetical protein
MFSDKINLGIIAIVFVVTNQIFAQQSAINMPNGRIAFSSDGNLHDSDDWGATALSLAFLHYAGLEKRFVHYDYNNHLGESRKAWELKMDEAAKGGAQRFGLDVSKFFNDQTEKDAAIANFINEVKKSNAKNPLWFVCAGPMQMAYELIEASPKEKRPFIYPISHGKWNNDHKHGACTKTWADMKADFPEMTFYEIADQNKSNGEDDFHSHIQNWFWLRDSTNENWKWLYNVDDTEQVDRLEKWKSDTEKAFDVSDAGMTYWLITGGPNGGNDKAGWREAKALFENKTIEQGVTPKITLNSNDYIFIEAESTTSNMGDWKRIKKADEYFVEGASGWEHLEFQGNEPKTGTPNSPLTYKFNAPKDGNFRLLMMTSKRLEGVRGDMCNDAFVKMDGNFSSATNLTKDALGEYIKFFQEGSTKTPEKEWHWAYRAEKGSHKFFNLIYGLKKDESYILTVAGRSHRFSFDYMILYDADKFSERKAQDLFRN